MADPGRFTRDRLREDFYAVLDLWPRVGVAYRRQRLGDWPVVTRDHDLVVEGYPASANSFLREVVREANPGIMVASHTHTAAQVHEGIRYCLPVVVPVRAPADAVASIVTRRPGRVPAVELRRWARFHRRVVTLREDVLVAPFEWVVADPAAVVAAITARFGVELVRPEPEQVAAATRRLAAWDRRVWGPDAGRSGATPDADRAVAREEVAAALMRPALAPLLSRCRQLHRVLVAGARPSGERASGERLEG